MNYVYFILSLKYDSQYSVDEDISEKDIIEGKKVTKETEYIFTILKQHLNGELSYNIEDINWNEVIEIARMHQIQSILYFQCKSIPIVEAELKLDYYMCLQHFVQIKETQQQLQTMIGDKQCLFFKGMSVANLYPHPPLRSMGDIDVLVPANILDNIDQLLISNQYLSTEKNKDEWIYTRNHILVEVHTSLMHHDQKNYTYFDNPWIHADGEKRDWEYWFLYLISHLRAHLVAGGVGIRQFYDLAVVIKSNHLDFQRISKEAKEMGIDKFTDRVYTLLSQWFGVDVPITVIDDTFVEKATDEIIMNGLFGNVQDHEIKMGIARTVANCDGHYQKARFSYYCSKLFPSYEVLCEYDHYRFIKGKKCLLPVAWLYRWFISALDTRRRKSAAAQLFAPKEKVNERLQDLRKWGIF